MVRVGKNPRAASENGPSLLAIFTFCSLLAEKNSRTEPTEVPGTTKSSVGPGIKSTHVYFGGSSEQDPQYSTFHEQGNIYGTRPSLALACSFVLFYREMFDKNSKTTELLNATYALY